MEQEELEKVKTYEWNRLIKKISKDCKECDGLSFIPIYGEKKASPCPICIPKAKTITFLKESGMNVDDIKNGTITDTSLLKEKAVFIIGEQKERLSLGFGLLKEHAKNQKSVFYIEMPNLIFELKRGNRDILRHDVIFIDSIDIYRNMDQFILPWFDGILFTYKNNPNKKIIVSGLNDSDGYAGRFLETYGTRIKSIFV